RLLVTLALLAIGANFCSYMQVYKMIHFSSGGTRTSKSEDLSKLDKVLLLFTGINVPRPENVNTPDSIGCGYRTFRISSEKGVVNEVWEIPAVRSKSLAILFHGYAGRKSDLLAEAKEFHDRGYWVWLVDFSGSGGSTGDETTVGCKEAVEVASVFREARRTMPQSRIVLFAHSMGSAAILRSLREYFLDPSAVILECPFDSLLSTVENRFHLMGYPSFPFAQLMVFWGGVQMGFNGFAYRPVDDAGAVQVPVLLLIGEKDDRVTVPQARSIYDRLQGSKKFVVVPGVGHRSYLAVDPALWKTEVFRFLENKN
ncbi:MAG TPA: alpha/beta fold hydrolase, partial [bacterium]